MSKALSSGAFTRTRRDRVLLTERAHIAAILSTTDTPSACALHRCAAVATSADDFTALRVLSLHAASNDGCVRAPHLQLKLVHLYRELSPGVA